MRKVLAVISYSPLFLIPVKVAFAQGVNPCPTDNSLAAQACKFNANSFGGLIGTLIEAIFVLAVIVALGYLIYGAIRWIMSEGDKSKVSDARNHIIAAVIGLVIVFLSYFIINVILSIFFNTNIGSIQLPHFTP